MKTIQFILSFILVAVLASCSADNDVLNEMEQNNQLPSEENVTVTLSLATGLTTRSISKDENADKAVSDSEKQIYNCVVLVLGNNDILLAKLTASDFGEDGKLLNSLTVKKQTLNVYAIANFNDDDQKGFTASTCRDYMPDVIDYSKIKTLSADKPKSGMINVSDVENTVNISIELKQLTARIDPPKFFDATYEYKSASLTGVEGLANGKEITNATFPLYVYPSKETQILLTGEYSNNKKIYSFGPFTIGVSGGYENGIEANNIYKLVVKAGEPDMPGALWIDWYVADMLTKDVVATVGGEE